jgi:hypothetical protein
LLHFALHFNRTEYGGKFHRSRIEAHDNKIQRLQDRKRTIAPMHFSMDD